MKKVLCVVLTLAMTLSFVACGSKGNETKGNDDKKEGGKRLRYWYLVR